MGHDPGVATTGRVRVWHAEQGWGVLDSAETPGGCWAHFSVVEVEGCRTLSAGQAVELEWEAAQQDGYVFRAVRAWPAGGAPVAAPPVDDAPGSSSAYSSTLTITWDEPG